MNLYEASMLSALIIILLSLILGGICFFAFKWEGLSKRVKELEGKKPKEFSLKQIPRKPILKDIDPNSKILFDVIESVKLEDWKCEVKEERSYDGGSYTITWDNPSKTTHIKGRMRMTEVSSSKSKKYEPYLGGFHVSTEGGSLSFGDSDDEIKNHIIVFIWDYIIKYHEDENKQITKSYNDSIAAISSKLITLNRSRKLNTLV